MAQPDPRFLEAVVHRGLISTKDAESIAARSSNTVSVVELLIKEGYITDRLAQAIAEQIDHGDEPTQIANFKILAKLGQGGMGTVYKALQVSMQREVALKVIAPRYAVDKDFCERFIREARTAGQINHPNVITCYDVGKDQGYLYMALELITGGDAAEVAAKHGGRMRESQALEIISDCASGLIALKRAGLIHRDIKPANIFITKDGIAKLADLGLARSCTGDDRMTITGAPMGTPAFMSPEQASGDGVIDIRTDIYALGATLFALVTGEAPYKGTSAWAVVAQVLKDPVPDPRHINRGVSDGAASVIMKAMAKDRDERYASPEALIEDLDLVAAGKAPRRAPLLAPVNDTWAQANAPSHREERAQLPTSAGLENAPPSKKSERRENAPISPPKSRAWPWFVAAATVVGVSFAMQPPAKGAPRAQEKPQTETKAPAAEIPLARVSETTTAQAPEQPAVRPAPLPPATAPQPESEPMAKTEAVPPLLSDVHRVAAVELPQPKPTVIAEPIQDEEITEITEEPVPTAEEAPAKPLVLPDPSVFQPPEVAKTPLIEIKPAATPPPSKGPGKTPVTDVAKSATPPNPDAVTATWQRFVDVKAFRCTVEALPNGNVMVSRLDPNVRDLSILQALPIEVLNLDGCERLEGDLSAFTGKPLRIVKLRNCRRLQSLRGLEGAPLSDITLVGCEDLGGDLSALRGAKLRELNLSGCASLTSLDGLQGMPLTDLNCTDCRKITSVAPLRGMQLRSLKLTNCENLKNLDGLQGMPLADLSLSGCKSLRGDLSALRGIKLARLALDGCQNIESLDGLQGMQLTELNMSYCWRLSGDLAPLNGMPLTSLNASRCSNLTSLNGLQSSPLKKITLTRCGKILDYTPLAGIKGVEIVR